MNADRSEQLKSIDANECLAHIVRRRRQARPKDGARWFFDYGVETLGHVELAERGLITKLLGTPRGFAWELTPSGLDWVLPVIERASSRASLLDLDSGVLERAPNQQRNVK